MRVAIVCDWLTNVGGAEKVLLAIHKMYPEAPIYTSQYNPRKIDWFRDADVRVGWMRIFPCSWRRFLGWFRARYFARLDLSDYDLVISVTGAEAKAVKTKKGQQKHERHGDQSNDSTDGMICQGGQGVQGAVHISYCHVPTQYYWQMYDNYVKNPGFGILDPLVRFCFKTLVGPLRKRDYVAAQGVDQFVTISTYAQELIAKYYEREAVIVHPPVEIGRFSDRNGAPRGRGSSRPSSRGSDPLFLGSSLRTPREAPFPVASYYITTSRQVTWKRLDLAVKACVKMGRRLVVIGEGSEHAKLVKMAAGARGEDGEELAKFLPVMGARELAKYLAGARGYLFPSLEPFGIAPVEALAAGCPVVAFGEGGSRDYVEDGINGVLFEKQTVKSLCEAIERFERLKFNRAKVTASVQDFGVERFERELRKLIDEKVA